MAMYNPYNSNMYLQDLQGMKDRIDKAMQQYQYQSQAPITQNFQIAPQTNPNDLQSAYVGNIDEVKGIFMTKNGVFVDKSLSNLWFKDTTGNIRSFTLTEIIEKDEKDIEIENLKKEIEELKSKKNKKETD